MQNNDFFIHVFLRSLSCCVIGHVHESMETLWCSNAIIFTVEDSKIPPHLLYFVNYVMCCGSV